MIATDWLKSLPQLQGQPSPFPGSQPPYPLNYSLYAGLDMEALKRRLKQIDQYELEEQVSLYLAWAEVVEATQADKAQFFISDRELRARLVGLNNATGWALVWGPKDDKAQALVSALQREHFQVYAICPAAPAPWEERGVKYLGARPTSAVYFYQMVARYPHLYGRITWGDSHAATDFIEDHGSGVIFLTQDSLTPGEEMMLLGGLLLGIPAVIPSRLSLDYGHTVRADDPQEMVAQALGLPNLRLRHRLRFSLNLPFNFDVAYAAEKIAQGQTLGGTDLSCLTVTNQDKGDGVEVVGTGPHLGIEIAVGDPRVDITMTDYLEEFAAQLPNYIQGASFEVREGHPRLTWRQDMDLQPSHLAQVFYQGLKAHFNLSRLKVRLLFSEAELEPISHQAAAFRQARQQAIAQAREESEPYFYGCNRCHSFALEHTCTITPERPAQCGSRSWPHVKARALLSEFDSSGLGQRYHGPRLHPIVEKGECLDPLQGEYSGVNAYTAQWTEGRTQRVFLHSIFAHPHTCCSCFQGVAFYIPQVDGIGLMDRGFQSKGPDGKSWDDLANLVAGKQAPGYAAFSQEYLKSARFFQGDGGWHRVVWMTRRLKERYAPEKDWIATEADVPDITGLKQFLSAKAKIKL